MANGSSSTGTWPGGVAADFPWKNKQLSTGGNSGEEE
jgi:hypothetical protein